MIVSEDKILCGSTDQNIISIWAENIEVLYKNKKFYYYL